MEDSKTPLLSSSEPALNENDSRGRRKHRLIVVEPILCVNALCFMSVIQLTSQWVYEKVSLDLSNGTINVYNTGHNDSKCGSNSTNNSIDAFTNEVQENTAIFFIFYKLAYTFPSLLTATLLGPYSDIAGRKYALVIPLLGTCLASVWILVVLFFNAAKEYLLIAQFISGGSGGWVTIYVGCYSYLADSISPEKRSFRMMAAETMGYLGMFSSNFMLAFLLPKIGFFWTLCIFAAIQLLITLYSALLVPETVTKKENAKFLSCDIVRAVVRVYFLKEQPRRRWKLWILTIGFLINMFAIFGNQSVDTLFVMDKPLCWGAKLIGLYYSCILGPVFVSLLIAKILQKLGASDEMIGILSGVNSVITSIYKSFVLSTLMMFMVSVVGIFVGLYSPIVRALLSKLVSKDEQGAMFTAVGIVETIAMSAAPSLVNLVYAATVTWWSGMAYMILGVALLVSTALLIIYAVRNSSEMRRLYVLPSED